MEEKILEYKAVDGFEVLSFHPICSHLKYKVPVMHVEIFGMNGYYKPALTIEDLRQLHTFLTEQLNKIDDELYTKTKEI